MKKFNTFFFLLLSITLCLITFYPQQIQAHKKHTKHAKTNTTSPNNLIETACQKAPHKKLCINMLESDPSTNGADLKGLALISIKLAASNASDIAEHVKILFNDTSLDPAVQDGVSECLEHYLDAAEQLDDAVAALLVKAYNDVETWVNVALGDADMCDAALGENDKVMAGKPEVFRQLCNNGLALSKVVAHKHK
ncbi:hypothetical protein UlMin_031166 [Ulmus minor]